MSYANRSRALGEGRGWQAPDAQPGIIRRIRQALAGVDEERRAVEQRTVTSVPWNTGGSLATPSAPPSVDSALALGAVYAASSLIARTVAGLPLKAYRNVAGRKIELEQLPSLFDEPSVQGDLFDWLHRAVTSLCLYGNAYGLITNRDGFGYPTGIEWLNPEHITVVDFAFVGPGSFLEPIWRWRGRMITKDDLVHVPWFTLPWRVRGLSPLAAYANSVTTGLGAQQFSADWFTNGGVPPGDFKNNAKVVAREEAEEISDRLINSIRRHRPIVHGMDWDYKPFQISPNEARFIETMKLTATQIAAIYGVPAERIGGEKGSSMTYQNVEQESIDFVQFTVLNYVRKLESAFFKLLPTRQYVRFNLDALIRPDMKARFEAYMMQRRMGFANIDELRDNESLPPLPNGEGESYAPLLQTGLAPEGMPSGEPLPPSESTLSEVLNLPPRRPYDELGVQGGGNSGR